MAGVRALRAGLAAFIVGLAAATWLPWPGVPGAAALALALGCFFCAAGLERPGIRGTGVFVACALGGFVWHSLWAGLRLDAQLPAGLEGVDMRVRGVVADLPRKAGEIQQFAFRIEQSDRGFAPRRVLLNYYGAEEIFAGRSYRMELRLSRPRGLANPGTFDYEAWLFQRGIAARGYVRGAVELLPRDRVSGLTAARAALKRRILRLVDDSPAAGIVVALVLGDDGGISERQRELFRQTGTSHLFVISGLHIGLICLLVYGFARFAAARFPVLPRWAPTRKIALPPALAAAAAYAAISGFGLPTQRAVTMAAVFILASLLNLRQPASLRFLLAMAAVLMLNPLSILGMGFWLSFTAVGALLLSQQPRPAASLDGVGYRFADAGVARAGDSPGVTARAGALLSRGLRPQIAVAVALSAPLWLWTGELSLLAPLVNLAAIPLVGFVIVPLCLLGACVLILSESWAALPLRLAGWLLELMLRGLQAVVESSAGFALFEPGHSAAPAIALLAVGSALALLPRGFPGRRLSCLLLLPLLFAPQPAPRKELLRLHVLDVGQGLAVVAQTRRHVLLYDTGAALSADWSMGERVVVPVLRRLGIDRLDAVILSHADNDHSGGYPAVAAAVPVDRLYSSFPPPAAAKSYGAHYHCRDFIAWRWDDVEFQFLHPDAARENDNDNSCVLRIRAAGFGVLLPGDIEAGVERELAAKLGGELRSDVLLAAHHGSNTSSSWAFLKMADPQYIIFAAGYRNAFGHPAARVVERAAAFTPRLLETSAHGMISIVYPAAAGGARVHGFRLDYPRYWRDPAPAMPDAGDSAAPLPAVPVLH